MLITMARMRAWAFCALAAVCTLPQAADRNTFPAQAWDIAGPAAGWSAEKLKAADDYAATLKTDAFLVVHHGEQVHAYGDVARPMNLASVRKSILSILYGKPVASGAIALDRTLRDLGIDDKEALTEQERSATLRQLLRSTSGVYHPAAYETSAMKTRRPARGSHAPGSYWYYNNWDFNVLGAVYAQQTGRTVFEALQAELAQPLQFQDFRPVRDTEWVTESASRYPAYVMHLSARDLARVGVLMARQGQWRGQQLVPAAWVDESTGLQVERPRAWLGYGYMWWVPQKRWNVRNGTSQHSFLAEGNLGQYLFVDPEQDLVVVHRVDSSLRRYLFGGVSADEFFALLERILAAAPRP